jgi:hypothetical protein
MMIPSTSFTITLTITNSSYWWRMASAGMLHHGALVRTPVSEELSAFFIRVTRICERGTTLAVTSNRRMLRRNTKWERKLVWNSELRMQSSGDSRQQHGFVNGQSTKRGPKLREKGRAGLFVNMLWMQTRVTKCPWVMSQKFQGVD